MEEYIFPCRQTEDSPKLTEKCTCSEQQCSDHCQFVTALDITYGLNKLFVSLAETTLSTFIRSEVLHHGRTHLRACRRKYFYQKNPSSSSKPLYQENINAFRSLELLLGEHVPSLAQTLSYSAIKEQLRLLSFPQNLNEALHNNVREAIKSWLESVNTQKQTLGRLIDAEVNRNKKDFGERPDINWYVELFCKTTLPKPPKKSPLDLDKARDVTISEFPDNKNDIRSFFGDLSGNLRLGQNLFDTIHEEWKKQLTFLFSTSMKCRELYDENETEVVGGSDNFIGFVDFRPRAGTVPIAMAIIAQPSTLKIQDNDQQDRSREVKTNEEFTIIHGDYIIPFGMAKDHHYEQRLRNPVPSDLNIETGSNIIRNSSFYAMHDSKKESGTRCAHLCIIMACGLLSNQGNYTRKKIARIPGPFEVSFLATKLDHQSPMDRFAPQGRETWEFDPTEGLTPNRVVDVLKTHCNVNAFFWQYNATDINIYVLERLLEACISADFPVILFCNATKLYEHDFISKPSYSNYQEDAHCIPHQRHSY